MSTVLKSSFTILNKYDAFLTKGKIQVSHDGKYMLCGCGNKVKVLEVQSGKIIHSIGEEEDEDVTCFILSPDNESLIIATQHLILRQWNWRENILMRSWKAIHNAPISCMAFDETSTLLATGSSDSTIKIWDIVKKYCTHNLRGHQGVISVVSFHPDISRLQLISSGEDYKVRVWDLKTSQCILTSDAHYSIATSLAFSNDGNTMISGGRDSIICVWDVTQLQVKKTIPVFEAVESVILVAEGKALPALGVTADANHVLIGGSKGILSIWNTSSSRCVYRQKNALSGSQSEDKLAQNITQVTYNEELQCLLVVSYDHNILIFNITDLSLNKQFVGHNDEILDMKFLGTNDSHLVVASNTNQIKVFEVETWSCQIIDGHTDIVLALDTYNKAGNLIVSGSKDSTVRVWKFDEATGAVSPVSSRQGHTQAVECVSFPCLSSSFFVSGSKDHTIKVWPLCDAEGDKPLPAPLTVIAHEMDINTITISPNDKFLATCSHDKTAKLWRLPDLSLLGVMRGHKRGVWSAKFSPVDQCLATSSGDATVKVWSLTDFTCVKTFEGHDSAVLKVTFMTRGMQLLSCGTDGLIKLWTIKSGECVNTLDAHDDKIWCMDCNRTEDRIVSGAADSSIIFWKDVTEQEMSEVKEKQETFILQEQELSNLLHNKKYIRAIGLAITLEQPFRVLSIVKEILMSGGGDDQLEKTLFKLRMDQIDAVLRFAVKWNMNSKHCHAAQFVLNTILKKYNVEELSKFPNIKSTLEGLLPYTDRHFQRMNRLIQQATFLDYTWQCMKTVTGSVAFGAIEPMITETVTTEASASDEVSAHSANGEPSHFIDLTKDSQTVHEAESDKSASGSFKVPHPRDIKHERTRMISETEGSDDEYDDEDGSDNIPDQGGILVTTVEKSLLLGGKRKKETEDTLKGPHAGKKIQKKKIKKEKDIDSETGRDSPNVAIQSISKKKVKTETKNTIKVTELKSSKKKSMKKLMKLHKR